MKPSLADAAGLYLHAYQTAPISPYEVQRDRTLYQDLWAEHFKEGLFRVSPDGQAPYLWASYAVKPDGQLVLVSYNLDSSD